jgi:hypothetical protein
MRRILYGRQQEGCVEPRGRIPDVSTLSSTMTLTGTFDGDGDDDV